MNVDVAPPAASEARHVRRHANLPPRPDALVADQAARLAGLQRADGHFLFELEADATIPSEYILLRHFLGDVDGAREAAILPYLRRVQNADGSWPLFAEGAGNVSASVKAYWAMKLAGEAIDAPHMARARDWVLARGGAAKANVFTRIHAWRCLGRSRGVACRSCAGRGHAAAALVSVPPDSKIAYWSRTVHRFRCSVLYALKRRARPAIRPVATSPSCSRCRPSRAAEGGSDQPDRHAG